MKVAIIGGGPGGLYLAILLRRANPATQVIIYERNRIEDTFGFGVVLSDATEGILAEADDVTHAAMSAVMHRWGDIDVHINGECITSGGHGFSRHLAEGAARDPERPGARHRRRAPGTDRGAAGRDAAGERTTWWWRPTASTARCASRARRPPSAPAWTSVPTASSGSAPRGPSPASSSPSGRTRTASGGCTRTSTPRGSPPSSWRRRRRRGRRRGSRRATRRRRSPTARRSSRRSSRGTGSSPTARSGGSSRRCAASAGPTGGWCCWATRRTRRTSRWARGTKLAMEDAIELSRVLQGATDVAAALATYEEQRRPGVASVQRAAQASLEWFEATERYDDLEPLQFAYSLLTRSLRITHENLRARDPAFVERVERWYADKAGVAAGAGPPEPPALPDAVPLRDLVLTNRVVVSPMCQYSAVDGVPNDWHLQHLGQPGRRRRGAGHDGDDRRERRGADHARVHRDLHRRAGGGVEADRGLRARSTRPTRGSACSWDMRGGRRRRSSCGRETTSRSPTGAWPIMSASADSVEAGEPGAARDDAAATWTGCATSSWALPGAPSRRDST